MADNWDSKQISCLSKNFCWKRNVLLTKSSCQDYVMKHVFLDSDAGILVVQHDASDVSARVEPQHVFDVILLDEVASLQNRRLDETTKELLGICACSYSRNVETVNNSTTITANLQNARVVSCSASQMQTELKISRTIAVNSTRLFPYVKQL